VTAQFGDPGRAAVNRNEKAAGIIRSGALEKRDNPSARHILRMAAGQVVRARYLNVVLAA
jgi:hypothetical protein